MFEKFRKKNKTDQKSEEMQQNKFSSRRKYRIQEGLPETILKRLEDLYTLLTDIGDDEYLPTTVEQIRDLTGLNTNYVATCVREKLIDKRTHPGGSPRFEYKWNTIKPTKEMAINLIKVAYNTGIKMLEDSIGEQVETDPNHGGDYHAQKLAEWEKERESRSLTSNFSKDTPNTQKINADVNLVSYSTVDGIMTIHVNLEKFNITEEEIINAVMKAALTLR